MDEFVPSGSGGLHRPETVNFGPEGTFYVISESQTGVLRYDGERWPRGGAPGVAELSERAAERQPGGGKSA